MGNSLREKLLELGFRPKQGPAEPARPGKSPQGKATSGRTGPSRPRGAARRERGPEQIDLARAYALRQRQEQAERAAAERERQEQARRRREAIARLAALLEGRTLNDPGADIARHFPYGGKIKRIYVTTDQLKALNAGELGLVQLRGRYLLVDAATLAEAEGIFPEAVALKVDPGAAEEDDSYADPKYRVPDDLVW